MSAPFPNLYTHRRVAETAAKACDVCYKPSSSVLITHDNKDFFYICPAHLKDRYFCTPQIDEDAAKAAREKELAEEKEKLMKEYQERQEKKANKGKEKEEEKDKDKDKDKKDKDGAEAKDNEKKESQGGGAKSKDEGKEKKEDDDKSPPQEEPRVFELKSAFYQQRVLRKRQAEAARRNRERVAQPNYFPSVPSEPPAR